MMVLNASGSDSTSSAASARSVLAPPSTSSNIKSQTGAAARRRRSKGTIAGFAFGISNDSSSGGSSAPLESGDGNSRGGDHPTSATVSGSSTSGGTQQPQHSGSGDASIPNKPCHAARLALMCCQNAIRMGARTQLGLCPPGRARRNLKIALRQKTTGRNNRLSVRNKIMQPSTDTGGYFGVDKMLGPRVLEDYSAQEEDFLVSTNTFDAESDEEASSGDDDDLNDIDALMIENSPVLDDEKKYATLDEPLFTPLRPEHSGGALNGQAGSGKLPFNRRKLRYFDSVTAADKMAAREYLNAELRKSKVREISILAKHLKKAQRKERRRIKEERGIPLTAEDLNEKNDDLKDSALIPANVAKFDQAMVPSTAAALILESLTLNPLESVEGMAKCYEGIVAAGVALLESTVNDPTSPSIPSERRAGTRTEIMTALTPLLITSLEQPSGDVIISLARLRRMCGTARYQRRFVQRVAPALIRPPKGAMWCLRHHNDMEPIMAAAELIFDCASEIFSKGWYDRGQLLLADSKRAETLNAAAMQLKNLRTGPGDTLMLGNSRAGHNTWRHNRGLKDSSECLAEWEVIAVDRQIRVSISNIMSMDWTKPVVQSRDAEVARSFTRSRNNSRRQLAGVHAAGDTSPKLTTPLSPARVAGSKVVSSPAPPMPAYDKTESSPFTPIFTGNEPSDLRSQSPVPPPPPLPNQHPPVSPPLPNRTSSGDMDLRINDPFSGPSVFSKSPKRPDSEASPGPPSRFSPSSPSHRSAPPVKESISGPQMSSPSQTQSEKHAPTSPASVGTTENVPSRFMSSVSSLSSTLPGTMGTQPAHYRMLTSTAAERKRTVAACRALRAQITRFEDAFVQLHGRPPKGAAERAPLATTYAQYREWKRAIRADAACRIQALFRGASARWRLLRSNEPRISRIILSRAGQGELQPQIKDSILSQLSIPAEIGQPLSKNNDFAQSVGPIGPDGFPTQSQNTQSLGTQWGNQVLRRRPGGVDGFGGSPAPRPTPSPSGGSSQSVSSTGSGEFSRLPLPELQARKRDLKQQLKQYDMSFARRHGRMPVKAEKEPIRHLYERYNALKSQITSMEQDSAQSSGSLSPVAMQPTPNVLPQRTISPVSTNLSSGDDSPTAARKIKAPPQRSPPSSHPAPILAPPPQDLTALKAEKQRLHQMLRAYEKDFFKEHKRQVSSFADIRPVASNYRRYKEIKKAIAAVIQQVGDR